MSKISTIYDNVKTRLSTVFPDHYELHNPRNIELNNRLWLTQGQGVLFGSASNTERNLSCRLSIQRDMTITLTRQIYGTDQDLTAKSNTEKQLFEDQYLLIDDLEKDPDLDETTARIAYVSDGGIVEVTFDEVQFLMIQSLFQFEYLETLT